MSISIIECSGNLITITNFSQKDSSLILEYEASKILKAIQDTITPSDWINEAAQVIKELVIESKSILPTIIILPGSSLLTKVIQVPKVTASKQSKIIETHVHNLLGTSKEEYLAYTITASRKFSLNIVCTLVKKYWIESFCKAIEPINIQVISIEPPAIHYYNAFIKLSPNDDEPLLLIMLQNLTACCLFLHKQCVAIYQIHIIDLSFPIEIEELIELYKRKHPQSFPKKIFVFEQNTNSESFINSLELLTELPTRTLFPLDEIQYPLKKSIGAAYKFLFNHGLSINLTPPTIRRTWSFERSKKGILTTGIFIAASLLILLNNSNTSNTYYKEKCNALETKVLSLREISRIINHNEELIDFYNSGLKALNSYIASQKSWIHFLNSLQNVFISIPHARIYSLKIDETEYKNVDGWSSELMHKQNRETLSPKPQLMHISGSFRIEVNQSINDAIDQINHLMLKIAKLESIEEIQNLHFDTHNLPIVPFSFSLALKPNVF